MKTLFTGLLCLFFLGITDVMAQNRFDALRFSTQYPIMDPANAAVGGSASANFFNYGSVLRNPATLAMARESSVSFGLGLRDVDEEATYLGRRRGYDDTQFGITNAGYVYSFPTVQGSLVIGGGYNQLMNFNRSFRINGYNTRSSITDYFFDNSFYFDTAFNAFAIEEDDFGQFPIFRPFFDEPFLGIDQTASQTERGQIGEFSISVASEFVENLFVGVTLGIPVGTYSYRLDFLERDTEFVHGDLDTEIGGEPFTIPAVSNIVFRDQIDADISGFSARLGMVYKPIPNLSFGLSYSLPTRYNIDESYSVFIQTNYENGTSESYETIGTNSYKLRTASRLSFGASTHGLPVNLSASVERVGYSRMEFRNFGDLGLEIELNDDIRDDFQDVLNVHLGATLNVSDVIQPSFGYSFLPSASRSNDMASQFITGGLRIGVNQSFSIDLALQYNFFDDTQVLYDFYNYNTMDGSFLNETVNSSVSRYHAMIGINLKF
jgi:long-subunit fatty acid transport protein